MVPPTMFVSGAIAVLHLCNEVYNRFRGVRRFREDCEKLAHFVHRIEAFITETEDDTDMTGPGWEAAFSALHESLLEVVGVFEDCARYGMIRSMINADDLNLRLNAISQRLTLSLQLIPIQKTKAMDKRLVELQAIQAEIRTATFSAVRAAEEQSASLKRLMDQSRVDTNKTHEMLEQVVMLLQMDPVARAAAAAAGHGPSNEGSGPPPPPQQQQQQQQQLAVVDSALLEAELADLHIELKLAVQNKNVTEEEYLEQIIDAITAMEEQLRSGSAAPQAQPPIDLRCPITCQLLTDPVILVESAQTYERAAIQEWLDRGNRKDPVTGVTLSSALLVPNVAVRKLAQDWAQIHGHHQQYHQQYQQQQRSAKAASSPAAHKPQQPQQQQQQQPFEDASSLKKLAPGEQQSPTASTGADDAFGINAKTAAILAAGATEGFSPFEATAMSGGPAFGSNSKGCKAQAEQTEEEVEKQLAHKAYARSVAAAAEESAAAGDTAVIAMPAAYGFIGQPHTNSSVTAAGAAPGGAAAIGQQPASNTDRQQSSASSADVASVDSSITFARDASARTLPSFNQHIPPVGLTGSRSSLTGSFVGEAGVPGPENSLSFWQGRSAGAAGPGPSTSAAAAQQQQPQQQFMPLQQQQQHQHQPPPTVQQRRLSQGPSAPPFADALIQRRSFLQSSALSTVSTRQERATAAAAAAAALIAQNQGSFGLQDLHGTLGRAAETRYQMSVRNNPAAAEALLAEREQLQQEQRQQRKDMQQQKEREYLQQHMERLMRSQSPEQQQQQQRAYRHSHSMDRQGYVDQSDRSGVSIASFISCPPNLPPTGSRSVPSPSSNDLGATAAGLRYSQSATDDVRSAPAATATAQGGNVARPSSEHPRAVSSSPRVGGLAALSFNRLTRAGSDAQSASQFDDRASVSSTGSSSSRRSMGKGLLGALKSIKYSMVYDDEKV